MPYRKAHKPAVRAEKTIRVVYPSGQLAYVATAEEARYLIRGHLGEGIGSKTKLRAVHLYDGPSRAVAGTRYVHRHETETNPHGVYELETITHLSRDEFSAVQLDVNPTRKRELAELEAELAKEKAAA